MAPKVALIDTEWAISLIGMRMKVPDNWWNRCKGRNLHDGKISSYKESAQKWMLVIDSEPDNEYGMAYQAVYMFADQSASTFEAYEKFLQYDPITGDGDDELDVGIGDNVVNVFKRTDLDDWDKIVNTAGSARKGRTIDPIPWVGEEDFTVNVSTVVLQSFKDARGEIRFENVFKWTLPRFGTNGKDNLFEWQAARMRNYMTKLIKDPIRPYKPRHYKPHKDRVITASHVARFYGCIIAKMLAGNPSITDMFCTREVFNAVEPVKNCMTLDAMKDLSRCLHFSDDWEEDDEEDWDEHYKDVKVEPDENTALHRRKFSMVEDAYNRRWQAMVNFGKWITADESRVAGWYKSVMTIGPDPKPIRTGATLHSLCVTKGPLQTYKLFVRVYGGKHDGDMNTRHPNTATLLKFVTLYSIMLNSFMGRGHCLVMDSAYMGDVMALIGLHIWHINMVGTVQANRTGGGKKGMEDLSKKVIKKGSYESLFYQHKDEGLTYAIWADNNFVKTLSNFHSPTIVQGGVKRKRRDAITKRRELQQSPVDCPDQMREYCETYHWIDKGNGAEAKFDLGGESHLHGWSPKLAARLFNMNLNNAYRIYCVLIAQQSGRQKPKEMRDCITAVAHMLLQTGDSMRKRSSGSPPSAVKVDSHGRKVRSDAKGQFVCTSPQGRNHPLTPRTESPASLERVKLYKQQVSFKASKLKHPWRSHQSVATVCKGDGGYCQYDCCPGLSRKNTRKRSYPSKYQCVECTLIKGSPVFLCNTIKRLEDGEFKTILCHLNYHTQQKNKERI